MKARVTKEFSGCEDDNPVTRKIKVDETIHGDLARVAVENGWAEEFEGDEPVDTIDVPEDLEKLKLAELKELAEKENVEIDDKDKKADLLRKIITAREVAS